MGYRALIELFDLSVMPYFRESYVLPKGTPSREVYNGHETVYYSKRALPDDVHDPFAHIEFALKHEGLNLELFSLLFRKLEKGDIAHYIRQHPTGKTARKIWFLYEFLTDQKLPLEDAQSGSYVSLLDPIKYYTAVGMRSQRHRILNNLLGNRDFCPFLRRTDRLQAYEAKDLSAHADKLINHFDLHIIGRAVNYMYAKETMSSFGIEREKPSPTRLNRFVDLLKRADHVGPLTKELLIDLQNSIVDERYADTDYRDFQAFIGSQERLDSYGGNVDYIAPKSEDVTSLMNGLKHSLECMLESNIHPVLIAAALAFGFVFIHPFTDGNGRLHRFLIHYVFARMQFVPEGAIFPVSATILKDLKKYDTVLESISKPLLGLIHYAFNEDGSMVVKNETLQFYRYIDFTAFAEYLFECVETTINTDFKNELQYLVNYDKTKKLLQNLVDMPDRKINLFIQIVDHNGKLSNQKKRDHFPELTDEEVNAMETTVKEHMKVKMDTSLHNL